MVFKVLFKWPNFVTLWNNLRVIKNAITPSSKINTLTEFPVCRSFFKVEPESLKQQIRNGVYKFKIYF